MDYKTSGIKIGLLKRLVKYRRLPLQRYYALCLSLKYGMCKLY